jgi:uncharacterized protein (DUF983 family)
MSTKEARLYSIAACKCPRCHEGDMFRYKLSWNPKKFMEMNEECDNCGLKFTPEVGFYYGAMYISYGFATIEFALVLVVSYALFGELDTWSIMGIVAMVFVVLSPINFRLGRSGWLNIFNKYDKSLSKKHSH